MPWTGRVAVPRPEALLLRPALANRYELMSRLRRSTPVYGSPFGFVVLTRYDDVKYVLSSRLFGARMVVEGAQVGAYQRRSQAHLGADSPEGLFVDMMSRSLLFREPPSHTLIRRALAPWFTRDAVTAVEHEIRAIAGQCLHDLVDEVQRQGAADLVHHLSRPLPLRTTASLLGLPTADVARLGAWSDAFAAGFDFVRGRRALHAAGVAVQEFVEYFRARKGTTSDRPGTLQELSKLEQSGAIEEQDLLANVALLLAAGHETTTSGISTSLWTAFRHDLMDAIAQGSVDADRVVIEATRLESPVQVAARTAVHDVDLGPVVIRKGTRIMAMLGAANRDPEVFGDPGTFLLDRDDSVVSFGLGLHRCLGAHLAAVEMRVAAEMVAALPLRISDEDVEWGGSMVSRGIRRLTVRAK